MTLATQKQTAIEAEQKLKMEIARLNGEVETISADRSELENLIAERIRANALGEKSYGDKAHETDRTRLFAMQGQTEKREKTVEILTERLDTVSIEATKERLEQVYGEIRAVNQAMVCEAKAFVEARQEVIETMSKLLDLDGQHKAIVRDEVCPLMRKLPGNEGIDSSQASLRLPPHAKPGVFMGHVEAALLGGDVGLAHQANRLPVWVDCARRVDVSKLFYRPSCSCEAESNQNEREEQE